MAEPNSVATATLLMAGAAVPTPTAFGMPLGLRANILLTQYRLGITATEALEALQ